jgi:hypothetical protein
VGGSPAYGRRTRHSRLEDWRSRSPGQYYSRSPRHRSSRSPRRSRSWSPAPRRGDHHKKRSRNASENWVASPEDSYRGEYCILNLHTLGMCRNAHTISVNYTSYHCGLMEALEFRTIQMVTDIVGLHRRTDAIEGGTTRHPPAVNHHLAGITGRVAVITGRVMVGALRGRILNHRMTVMQDTPARTPG